MRPSVILPLAFALLPGVLCDINVNSTDIVPDIINLDDAVRDLTAAVSAYTGGILLSSGIDFLNVTARLSKANIDISSLPQQDFELASIHELEDVVKVTLAIDNPKAVNELVSKKALIEQVPLQGGVVKTGLETLLAGHLQFTQQALDRTPESEVKGVQDVANIITNALQKGVAEFS